MSSTIVKYYNMYIHTKHINNQLDKLVNTIYDSKF